MTRFALLSVTDKTGVADFAAGLVELGFTVLSTGGTFRAVTEAGVPAVEVSDYTDFPEMMDGRLKTLHPKVHGGLLGRRGVDDEVMAEHGIERIDVVAVNLYRFRETVRRPDATRDAIVENIDIGGPAMIRSAAKNHRSVAVVVDPADYGEVLVGLGVGEGRLEPDHAQRLAGKAFAHTAAYDAAIATWFDGLRAAEPDEPAFGPTMQVVGTKLADLRYGENPHQDAALYADPDETGASLAGARQLGGKELSYNNLLDLDSALGLVHEFSTPACVVVKHNNPCGAAVASRTERAFDLALGADSMSAFGGIVALNRLLDPATARRMVADGVFLEAIVAPEVPAESVQILRTAKWGKNVRILELGGVPELHRRRTSVRPISGGFLAQSVDAVTAFPELDHRTSRLPTDSEHRALCFAWLVCKHVRSNAIVLARAADGGDGVVTTGIGAGQMSRVDAVKIAIEKSKHLAAGAVLASDAFFPFADGIESAIGAGVTAVIQPGGSRRDDEVIAAADAESVAMVFTGRRHFRH